MPPLAGLWLGRWRGRPIIGSNPSPCCLTAEASLSKTPITKSVPVVTPLWSALIIAGCPVGMVLSTHGQTFNKRCFINGVLLPFTDNTYSHTEREENIQFSKHLTLEAKKCETTHTNTHTGIHLSEVQSLQKQSESFCIHKADVWFALLRLSLSWLKHHVIHRLQFKMKGATPSLPL